MRKMKRTFKPASVMAADAQDPRERYRQRRENARAKKAALKQELVDKISACRESDDPIEALFELLVPSQGPSKYRGGELVRAMMRIMYRDYNDGDVFYEGYGVETCADAVAFLCQEMPELESAFENIAMRTLQDNAYTKAIKDIANDVVDYVVSEPEIAAEPNSQDYLKFDGESFVAEREWIPEYEIDVTMPDNVYYHLEEGDVDDRDLENLIEEGWDLFFRLDNATVSIENGYVYFEHLNRETYDEIEEYGYRWLEEIGDDWDEEFGSEEDRMEEDEEEE